MDKYKKLVEALRSIAPVSNLPLLPVQVTAITGESCTVLYGDLELTDVRLKATINGAANSLLLLPKVGSTVLVGSLTGDLKDLAVLKIDEVERMEYVQDGLRIVVDTGDNKVSIANEQVSLTNLFQQLTDLLKAFKVYTPSGPSGTALPDSLLSINNFETAFKQLLK